MTHQLGRLQIALNPHRHRIEELGSYIVIPHQVFKLPEVPVPQATVGNVAFLAQDIPHKQRINLLNILTCTEHSDSTSASRYH